MASNDAVLLCSLELRLLRWSIQFDAPAGASSPPKAPQFRHLRPVLNDVVALKEFGDYLQASSSSSASEAVSAYLQHESLDSAHSFYSEILPECVSSFLNVGGSEDSVELGY